MFLQHYKSFETTTILTDGNTHKDTQTCGQADAHTHLPEGTQIWIWMASAPRKGWRFLQRNFLNLELYAQIK